MTIAVDLGRKATKQTKNRLVEAVLLSTHNICFGLEIRKLFFWYALLNKVLIVELIGQLVGCIS